MNQEAFGARFLLPLIDATTQIVEVAYQPPQNDAPCSSISQDEVESLITVDDFDITALREAAEKSEEKNRNLPRKIRMDKFLRKSFPKSLIRSRPRPRDVEARLPDDRAPCVLRPRRRMKKKILSLEQLGLLRPTHTSSETARFEVAITTSRPAKASLISIFADDVKTRRTRAGPPPAPPTADAGDKVPIERYRRNQKEWILRMKLKDAPRFAQLISDLMNRKETGDKNEI